MKTLATILNLAKERAAQLAQKNKSIQSASGLPVGELATYSLPGSVQTLQDLHVIGEMPEFQVSMDAHADFLVERMSAYRDFACNIASPAVEKAVDTVAERIAKINVDATQGFDVDVVACPPLLKNPEFTELMARYQNGRTSAPVGNTQYPLYNHEQVAGMMMFGIESIDAQITDLLASLPDGHLDVIWQSLFKSSSNYPATVKLQSWMDLMLDYQQGHSSALVVFILAYRLSQNIQEDIGLDLAKAQDTLFDYAACAANHAKRSIEYFIEDETTSTMVRSYNSAAKKISVSKVVYDKWVAEGGMPEVLLGYLVSDKRPITLDAIAAGKEGALAAWDNYVRMRSAENDAIFDSRVRAIFDQVFEDSFASTEAMAAEKEILAKQGTVEKARAIFTKEIACVSASQLREDWRDAFWRAYAKARYHYSNAYDILSDVEYEMRVRGADADDAATTAMVNIICASAADQLDLLQA